MALKASIENCTFLNRALAANLFDWSRPSFPRVVCGLQFITLLVQHSYVILAIPHQRSFPRKVTTILSLRQDLATLPLSYRALGNGIEKCFADSCNAFTPHHLQFRSSLSPILFRRYFRLLWPVSSYIIMLRIFLTSPGRYLVFKALDSFSIRLRITLKIQCLGRPAHSSSIFVLTFYKNLDPLRPLSFRENNRSS